MSTDQYDSRLFRADLVVSVVGQHLSSQGAFRSLENFRKTCKKAGEILKKYHESINEKFYRRWTHGSCKIKVNSTFFDGMWVCESLSYNNRKIEYVNFNFRKRTYYLGVYFLNTSLLVCGKQTVTISVKDMRVVHVTIHANPTNSRELIGEDGQLLDDFFDILHGKYTSAPIFPLPRSTRVDPSVIHMV